MPEGETTALEAVEQAAQAHSDPPSEEDVEEQSQPEAQEAEAPSIKETSEGPAPEESQGPIPLDRHKAVLEKARKEREEAVQAVRAELEDYRNRLSWAETFDLDGYQRQQELLQELSQDPIGFHQKLQRELEAHPHIGPQLKQATARPEPIKPSLRSEDGTQQAYTASETQSLVEQALAQAKAEFAKQNHILVSELAKLQTADQERTRVSETTQYAGDVVSRFRQEVPGFQEHEVAIKEAFAKVPSAELQARGVEACLYKAALQVIYSPQSQKAAEKKVTERLKKKAGAGTLEPGTQSSSDAKRPKNVKELAKFLEARAKA